MPGKLVEALYCIHEMATPRGMEAVMDALEHLSSGLDAGEDATALDVAVQAWLAHPGLLERLHAELDPPRPCTFQCHRHPRVPGAPCRPDESTLRQIEADLDAHFIKSKSDRPARVDYYGGRDGAWFLARHGSPLRCRRIVHGGQTPCVFHRPARFDIVIHHPQSNQLWIHAHTKGQRELYRLVFGRRLFGDSQYFSEPTGFTLSPLMTDGAASLVCCDVPGLDWIRLQQIQLQWGGESNEVEVRQADDLFASLERRGSSLPRYVRAIGAAFLAKFTGCARPRAFAVCPAHRLALGRAGDGGLLEAWMRQRGFICVGERPARAGAAVLGVY